MKTLHLTLKKKWFDMIASGEKKEEYREIKTYWAKRLFWFLEPTVFDDPLVFDEFVEGLPDHRGYDNHADYLKAYDCQLAFFMYGVSARNGYNPKNPSWRREFLGTEIREGREEWGAEPGKKYFVIKLGDKI